MSLRGEPFERVADLPDGRQARVRVAVPDDPYIPKRELETVVLEVLIRDEVVATVNTILRPEQDGEGHALVREVVELLESGKLQPTAAALEPYADSLP
ncbi:MAG TPA: hypothetical protein VF101_01880 [Gaiellaceae bacterium]